MDLQIKNKVALITGASTGIGFAIAEQLAFDQAKVFMIARNNDRLQDAITRIRDKTNAAVAGIAADISISEDSSRIVEEAVRCFGTVNILVNNAGRAQAGALLQTSEEDWKSMTEVKLYGMVNCCRSVVPLMQKNGGGRIVNISSVGGIFPNPTLMISHALSAAINNFTKSLALEHAKDGILVNAIGVGAVTTDNWQSNMIPKVRENRPEWSNLSNEELIGKLGAEKTPIGRFGTPEEIAALTAFLVSERNGFVTGATIEASGGADRFI
ncbi:MAG: SDR family oxidoreductase [SAR324 cluster bacterium]|nr:SDR family oxidoreductase [SAR324 cluster bacterium]